MCATGQGIRLGHRPFPLKPACSDNNVTVNASATCVRRDGTHMEFCVNVAFTHTAAIINCGDAGSRNGNRFTQDGHCGTFLEIHREVREFPPRCESRRVQNGSPYDPDETYVINAQRVPAKVSSGYTTTSISLRYGDNASKIICNYKESTIREGSMVYVLDSSPECCCPPEYNNDQKTGHFRCPLNSYEDTAGPYAGSLHSLLHKTAFNSTANNYPYCPTVEDHADSVQCSQNDTASFGSGRVYNSKCPTVVHDDIQSTAYYTSPFLVGRAYTSMCFFWEACAGHPFRSGEYAEGLSFTSAVESMTTGCARGCGDSGCTEDTYFSFKGLIGRVTCIPTGEALCVKSDGKYDDNEKYYLVSFNGNRTSYPFRERDLALHQPQYNFQLWWVQRTRHNYIVQEKKGFRVSEPTCTFDSVNEQYFPYTIIDGDGKFVDTY